MAQNAARLHKSKAMGEIQFQMLGGRCKLVEEDITSWFMGEPTTVSEDPMTPLESLKQDWQTHQRSLRKQLQREARVAAFLERNKFAGVNSRKVMCCGFRYTYPLLQAAKSGDACMVLLLLRCGADPVQRDHWGYTAMDYLKSHGLRERFSQLQAAMSKAPTP